MSIGAASPAALDAITVLTRPQRTPSLAGAGGLAIHQRHAIVAVERENEHVGDLDEIAIAPLQLLAFALELHFAEGLLDDRDQLLGPERLQDERESAGAERADGRVDAGKAREEEHLRERRGHAQRLDEIDAAHVRQLHVDDGDVEASLRHPERGVTVGGGGDGQARHTGRDDGAERLDELGVVVDDQDAAGRARRGRRRERPRLRQRHRVSWSRAAASACR